ncbi:MAG: cytochrome c biogenesis protein CcdA [Armatimonadota bacterium]|nr:thioredoxin family protein [bacterium]
MRTYKLAIILLIAILTITGPAFAQFGAPGRIVSSKMYLSVDKIKAGSEFQLAVVGTIKKGYHIGAHDKAALYPAKLTLSAPAGIKFDQPVYPKAIRKSFAGEKLPVYEGKFVIKVNGHASKSIKPGTAVITSTLNTQACKNDQCFPPEVSKAKITAKIVKSGEKAKPVNPTIFASSDGDEAGTLAGRLAGASLLSRLVMLYFFGLLLAFTPCVYPMIPVTVGYFSGQGKSGTGARQVAGLAAVYVLGLALTYSILGAVAASTGGVFGAAMQSPLVVIGIALVLVVLSLSMFGLYELQPPAFILRKSSGRGGVLGALIMGLVFGVVAAPCVGPPILGLLLYVAKIGSPVMGFFLFFTLSLGLGTPLFLLAAFSAKMPVPGMWMVAVKKLAGFLLLGAAAYFMSTVSPENTGRYLVPLVLLAAGVYMGIFENSIKSSRVVASIARVGCAVAVVLAVSMVMPHHAKLEWQPYTPKAVASAAASGKPVMIDFTAKWCIDCRQLEKGPFSDPRVADAAKDFIKLRMDGTDSRAPSVIAAGKRYQVNGYPTVIFIDKSGHEIRSLRIAGLVNSKEMIRRIKAVQ